VAAVCVEAACAYVVVEEEKEERVCDALGGVGDNSGEETRDAVARVYLFGSVEDAVVGVLGGGVGGVGLLDALDLKTLNYQVEGVCDEVRDGRSC
jgi:hypothetical protein